MEKYSNRLAFMLLLALVTSGLITILLFSFETYNGLIPLNLEHVGSRIGFFALSFILIFDVLIVAIESLFPRPALKIQTKVTVSSK